MTIEDKADKAIKRHKKRQEMEKKIYKNFVDRRTLNMKIEEENGR